jgi:hypothetical protein
VKLAASDDANFQYAFMVTFDPDAIVVISVHPAGAVNVGAPAAAMNATMTSAPATPVSVMPAGLDTVTDVPAVPLVTVLLER